MPATLAEIELKSGFTLFDYQQHYLEQTEEIPAPQRVCLYYKTGAGKSFTALASIALWGYDHCVVIAPPATIAQWQVLGNRLGVKVQHMSHAKFRQPRTRLNRTTPVIADEFHMFGGQQAQGWKKLDRIAQHLDAPLVLMSATPNYNDAERVYCVQHILDPDSVKGGYLQFLYTHCNTEQNRFSLTPNVLGFKNHVDAAAYLSDLPRVFYLADDLVMDIEDIEYPVDLPAEMVTHSYDRRHHKMIGSYMEYTHKERVYGLLEDAITVHKPVMDEVLEILKRPGGVLIYSNHATVAVALSMDLERRGIEHVRLTGSDSRFNKETLLQPVFDGRERIVVGTATLATGTDGLDRVCHTLLIVDDTEDAALRRQLIGRITPRGKYVTPVAKKVFRLVPRSD